MLLKIFLVESLATQDLRRFGIFETRTVDFYVCFAHF